MPAIYFAHPIRTYGTTEALQAYRALQRTYPDHEIVDPEDLQPEKTGFSVTCRECMDEHMKKTFFPAIDGCNILAVWPAFNTCGIKCELFHAWLQDKELVYVTCVLRADEMEIEPLTLQEYHLAESVMETE